jgi:hypothetical protein
LKRMLASSASSEFEGSRRSAYREIESHVFEPPNLKR